MNLFKRKKPQQAPINYKDAATITEPGKQAPTNFKDAILPEPGIMVNGEIIIPAHNDFVLSQVVWEMQNKTIPPGAKETNIHLTNFYVFHSLKEGARMQGKTFLYDPLTLFFLIDFEDYGLIVLGAAKHFGLDSEKLYGSEKFRKLLN